MKRPNFGSVGLNSSNSEIYTFFSEENAKKKKKEGKAGSDLLFLFRSLNSIVAYGYPIDFSIDLGN